jgi:hypothetical protein
LLALCVTVNQELHMPQHHAENISRARWFALGALAASIAFAALLVAGDVFEAAEGAADTGTPSLVIEGN